MDTTGAALSSDAVAGSSAAPDAGLKRDDSGPHTVPYARKLLIKFLLRAINIQSFSQAHGNAARPQVCTPLHRHTTTATT